MLLLEMRPKKKFQLATFKVAFSKDKKLSKINISEQPIADNCVYNWHSWKNLTSICQQ